MALAFDLIMLCERDLGCSGRLCERDDARYPCSRVVSDDWGSACACACAPLVAGAEPAKVDMRVA